MLNTKNPGQAQQDAEKADVKPSDEVKEIIGLVDTLIASVNEAHLAKIDDWREACFQSADHTYETIKAALLAHYGQPDPAMAGDGISKDEIFALFKTNCVDHPGNYEVTPGQALKIAHTLLKRVQPTESITCRSPYCECEHNKCACGRVDKRRCI